MTGLKLQDLPEPAGAVLNGRIFLYGYAVPGGQRYIVWSIERENRRLHEDEFEAAGGRRLSDDERLDLQRNPTELVLPQQNARARIDYYLEPSSGRLRARIDIADLASGRPLTVTDVDLYPTLLQPMENVVAQALEDLRFPEVYAAWDRETKAGYWASALHRLRRAHGESGRDENEIFTLSLVRDCERLDPRFQALLPEVLALVGRLEQTPAQEMMHAFHERVSLE